MPKFPSTVIEVERGWRPPAPSRGSLGAAHAMSAWPPQNSLMPRRMTFPSGLTVPQPMPRESCPLRGVREVVGAVASCV